METGLGSPAPSSCEGIDTGTEVAEESGERFVADRFARLAWSAPVSIASVPQSPLNRLHDAHGVIYK